MTIKCVDYPDIAEAFASVVSKEGTGILICSTGAECIAAIKVNGIRAVHASIALALRTAA